MTSGADAKQVAVDEPAVAARDPISDQFSSRTASLAATVFVPQQPPALARYAVAVGASLLALALTYPFASSLQRAIFVLFWPAVLGVAWYGGLGPAVLTSALAVLAVDYFLVGTPGQLAPASLDDLMPFAVFLLASVAVSSLVNMARSAQTAAAKAAMQNAELASELELQAMELEQQLEESQSLSEELEQSTEELADRTAAAEAAEHFTAGILSSITHPFVVHDADWRFRFINDAASAAFRKSTGESHESPIGRVVWEVYPDIVGTVFEREMRRAATERKPVTFEAYYPARGAWTALTCFPLADGGLATQWIDITERKRAEERDQCLSRASEVLGSSLDYETTLDQLAHVVVPSIADWCAVHVVDESGVAQQLSIAHVDPEKVTWARELERRYPPRDDAPTGVPNVLRTGRPELHSEISDEMLAAGAIDDEHLRITRELGLESAMVVPLLSGTRVIGALTLVSAESGRRFSEHDLPLATELARRAAVAVEHARLHRQAIDARTRAERSARITDRLYALTARLTGAATLQGVADAVLAEARLTFGAERATISLLEDDGDTTRLLASIGYQPEMLREWRSYSLRNTIAATRDAVISRRGVFILSPDDARERYAVIAPALERVGTATAVVLPITADDHVRGVITLAWTTVRPLPSDEREFMELYAAQCGQALARALAFEAERVARERTELLLRVTESLAAATGEAEVARVVVSNLQAVLEPSRVAIYHVVRRDREPVELVLLDGAGMTPDDERRFGRFPLEGESPIAIVARTGEPSFLGSKSEFEAAFPHWPRDLRQSSSAWAALPLRASTGAPIGTVALGFAGDRQFTDDVRRYVGAIIDQAAQAFERVRLMQTEHTAREAAEEANRAKTQFLATMSHELRTPLNAISGYAELLSLGLRGPTTAEQQEDLGRIMRSQRHLLSVINDILNFARLEAGYVEYRVTSVPVSELLADLESLIRPQLVAKQLNFSCDPVESDLIVRADKEKVRQVLLNLLANAVKFTLVGGRIRVDCHHDDACVYIRVTDTGIGIPTDRRGAIFEPFVQLHRTLAQPAEGTGLGLAISRDLARGMGGELSVESQPGEGSTFTLALARANVVEPSGAMRAAAGQD
jgi:signal transduction histidine kinase/PAS domain-containing protein